jgi:hypothetical protein
MDKNLRKLAILWIPLSVLIGSFFWVYYIAEPRSIICFGATAFIFKYLSDEDNLYNIIKQF